MWGCWTNKVGWNQWKPCWTNAPGNVEQGAGSNQQIDLCNSSDPSLIVIRLLRRRIIPILVFILVLILNLILLVILILIPLQSWFWSSFSLILILIDSNLDMKPRWMFGPAVCDIYNSIDVHASTVSCFSYTIFIRNSSNNICHNYSSNSNHNFFLQCLSQFIMKLHFPIHY